MAACSAGWGRVGKGLEALFLLARAVTHLSEVPGESISVLAAAERRFSLGLGDIQPQLQGHQWENSWDAGMAPRPCMCDAEHVQRASVSALNLLFTNTASMLVFSPTQSVYDRKTISPAVLMMLDALCSKPDCHPYSFIRERR